MNKIENAMKKIEVKTKRNELEKDINLKYKTIEDYDDSVLSSMVFGKLFLKNKIFFKKYGKFFSNIIFLFLIIGVIFPIGQFVPTIIYETIIGLFEVFLFFAIAYIISFFLSLVLPRVPRIPLVFIKNIDILFYLILILCNIFYITLVMLKIVFANTEYNLSQIIIYSILVNITLIVAFNLAKVSFKKFIKVKDLALDYLYGNYKNMNTRLIDRVFRVLVTRSKQLRMYIIALSILIILKLSLFYVFNINQYKITDSERFDFGFNLIDFKS